MAEGEHTILHCDCNSFYASVECLFHPEYRNVPMAVCGDPESRRGIILAKNELAKRFHVETAETIWQAKRKCPQLVLAPAHHDLYEQFSKRVNELYLGYTDLVEPFSVDESWLDVTGSLHLFGSGKEIADELRALVRRETGLTISVGVSFNKVFAKMGSDYQKPDATTVLSRENFQELLFPLPVGRLLFVGQKTRELLRQMGISTVGELAGCDPFLLERRLGKLGRELFTSANGLDTAAVRPFLDGPEIKSVGNSLTFRRDLIGAGDIRLGLGTLADTVAARLRRHGLKCGTVQILIKNPQLHSISRQKSLQAPTYLAKELTEAGMELVLSSWNLKAPIRMLSLTGAGLLPADRAAEQLDLFSPEAPEKRAREERLETAMDAIRDKYGKSAVTSAGLLHNDIGVDFSKHGKTDGA